MRLRQRRTPTIDLRQPVEWKHPLNQGLVAWYLCHPQLAGTGRLYDLCNTGNIAKAGTLTNMAAPYSSTTSGWRNGGGRPGGFGAAIACDGTNDYVNLTSPTIDYSASPWSASVWAKFNSPATKASAFGWGDGAVSAFRYWALGSNSSGNVAFQAYNGANQSISGGAVGTTSWRHLAVTYNSGTATLYMDGIQRASGSVSVGGRADASNVNRLGYPQFSPFSGYMNGLLDDARIYNRALSSGDVASLYQSSSNQYPGVLRLMRNVSYSFPGVAAAASQSKFFSVI